MSTKVAKDWRTEFGINERKPPIFFSSKEDLTPSIPQAHVLRKAFNLLGLDGILCTENSPLVYFKQVHDIKLERVLQLHRQFWNHGGAPILVLISREQVYIYSGMSRPVPAHEALENPPSLVQILDRVSEGLREFLVSVESGEFFHKNALSFNPEYRVDRDLLNNLKDTREVLDEISQHNIDSYVLDALLCRMVFTCYLFDREVIGRNYLRTIGSEDAVHLRDVLKIQPVRAAKAMLYKLFHRLGDDFNGDLFDDDLEAEAKQITNKHIETLNDFFHGTLVRSGQQSFWPYDFGVIPIETISAIYEHFLKAADHQAGAFYTPRFLAEVVLDIALEESSTLLGKRFLDPACGSGIFLVGLFNRIAEEWKQSNPNARNHRRARELLCLLQDSLFGVDINPTACRITAFSLYLAYLDQLTPRDIQELQKKGSALPRLISSSGQKGNGISGSTNGNIRCSDFFAKKEDIPINMDIVIGNPPWGSIATDETFAGQWCKENGKPLPDKQIAVAFLWKAPEHVSADGRICFVLPYGTLFKHSSAAVSFQKEWISQHKIERVLNLADFSRFLFKKAGHPALVVRYKDEKPADSRHQIEYWIPKADWTIVQAEVITIPPTDRLTISVGEILQDLDGEDAPQIWKQRFWATPRDLRLLDRLSLYPRLRDHVRRSGDNKSEKPWVMAEGFQPVGKSDEREKAKSLKLPSKNFIQATSGNLNLFLLLSDCEILESTFITVRNRSNINTEIFRAPHVLIPKGFKEKIAFCDFDVSFRHALRGIHGPVEYRDLLIFLAAYLRTPLAHYFVFHTSSSWGMYRKEAHVEEVLRLPMPFPHQQPDEQRSQEIVKRVADIVKNVTKRAETSFISRNHAIQAATADIEPLIDQYFDIQPLEKLLIADTLNIIIPSIQPNQKSMPVSTVKHSSVNQQKAYMKRVCDMLNIWAANGQQIVRGTTLSSDSLGIGIVVLEKIHRSQSSLPMNDEENDVLLSLDRIRKLVYKKHKVVNPVRGLVLFDKNRLYIVKPIGQRHWTQTAAINDADEIAGTILMHSYEELV